MSLNESIVSLYKQKKLEKGDAYQLLSQLNELTKGQQETIVSERLTTEFQLQAERYEYLAVWCYFIAILENQNDIALTLIEHDERRAINLVIQEQDSLNDLIARLQSSAEANAEDGHKYLFSYHSGVDRGIASVSFSVHQDSVELQADPDAVGKTRFQDWPAFFSFLLPQLKAHPEQAINEMDLLPAVHKSLLEKYNRTQAYLPADRTLIDILDPVMNEHRDAVAVQTSEQAIRYAQLLKNAYQLANLLRKTGVKANSLVPIICQRNVRMPMALYGIVLSGGAYVPLEPTNPAERIETIVEQTAAEVIVVDAQTLKSKAWQLSSTKVKTIVCLDHFEERTVDNIKVFDAAKIARQLDQRPVNINKPQDLCYIIFTSGSTGKPKGVMISHLNIVNTLIGVNNLFAVNRHDRICCFSSYGFDLSVWDIFGGFLAGATVFIPSHQQIKDPEKLYALLAQYQITIWDSVPTGMSQLLIPLRERQQVEPIDSLRLAMLSGEFIPLGLPDNIRQFFPRCHVSSLGGATEGTVWSIYYPVNKVSPHWKSIPYGYPLANQQYFVFNEAMKPCAIGQQGMLYIGGLGVAQGYFADSEKTQAAFKIKPGATDATDIIYKTGDLGILTADGTIEIVGRSDSQVKIRGYRVELGEVETQFSAISAIDQAAIIAKDDAVTGKRLIAFYTSAQGEIAADQLRLALKNKLPEYMLPSQFVYLKNPPTGLAGKLDRKALTHWQVSRSELSQTLVSAQTDEEHALVAALQRILNMDTVGIEDDFFLIGGDSLLALQYLSAINNLGYQIGPGVIMEGRTIRNILRMAKASDQRAGQLTQAQRSELSPMQYRFIHQLGLVNRGHWNQSVDLLVEQEIDVQRLTAALDKVVAHHPMLRSGLAEDSPYHLVVKNNSRHPIEVHRLNKTLPLLQARRITALIHALQSERDVTPDSIGKMLLIQLAPERYRIIWSINHFAVDAHCWRVLLEDLAAAYFHYEQALPVAGVFSDYIDAVKEQYPAARQSQEQNWRQLSALPAFVLPRSDSANTEAATRTQTLVLNQAETSAVLNDISKQAGTNLHLYTLTAVTCALGQWTQTQSVAMDIISNGRDIAPNKDFSRTIGWFATHNHFDAPLNKELQISVSEIKQYWQQHQRSSQFFVEGCNRAGAEQSHPLKGYKNNAVLYNFLGMYDNLVLPDGWRLKGNAGQDRGAQNRRTHQLEIEVMVVNAQLCFNLHYSEKQFKRSEVKQLSNLVAYQLQRLIRQN